MSLFSTVCSFTYRSFPGLRKRDCGLSDHHPRAVARARVHAPPRSRTDLAQSLGRQAPAGGGLAMEAI